MDMLEESYTVKLSIIVDPKIYRGADIGKVYYPDGSYACTMCSKFYTKEIMYNVKNKFEERNICSNWKLSGVNCSSQNQLFAVKYRPGFDMSVECDYVQTI